jgi:cation:H+ antiporter
MQQAGGTRTKRLGGAVVLTLAGLAALILGGRWMLDGAARLARDLGVDELIIGLTVVAIGTSLPEIAATVLAAARAEPDLAVGNAVGSSIYNLLAILGVCGIAAPAGLRVAASGVWFDLPVLAIAALLCVPVFLWGGRITRGEGVLLILFYVGYVAVLMRTAQLQSAITAPSSVLLPFLLPPVALLAAVALDAGLRGRRREA